MTEGEVRVMLQKECAKAGSNRQWALAHKLSAQYVGDVIAGKRPIGPAIVKALGLRAVTTYRRIK